jgi:hypothetical protein
LSLIRRQSAELEPGQHRRTTRPFEGGCKTLRGLAGAERNCREHGRCGRPAQQRTEQLDRARVSPVEVVEHEDQRPRLRETLEQHAHRSVAAVALVLERDGATGCERRQRGQDVRELCLHVVVEGGEQVGVEALDVLIQRIHEDRKRQLALELRRRPREDEVPAQLRTSREFPQQPRLADTQLAHQLDRSGRAFVELVEHPLERIEFVGAPDEQLMLARLSCCHAERHQPPLAGQATTARSRRARHR